uniref:RNase H type-1 domain-containing protein n=1 Tax=Fagus sylvatica TaxID=28930 RepID=A0A2N9HA44_FAGSY
MEALRSKYKVTESWLKEALRKYASNAWRAVERMKSLIVKGACFLVGDGLSIDIWKEPWVPWLPKFTPKPTAHSNNTQPMTVAELIDPICRCWNETKLNELFDATSISTIKRISIPTTLTKDKLVWILEPKGNFSVKLGEAVKGWKDLWKLKIHERLKMALWFGTSWAIHSCKLSILNSEDILHLVTNPPIAPHILDTQCSREQNSIQIAITLDNNWTLRNQVVHRDPKFNLLVTIKNLETRILEHINALEDPEFSSKISYKKRWEPPDDGFIKLNVDAAIDKDIATISVVARNHQGFIIKAWTKLTSHLEPALVEANAIS